MAMFVSGSLTSTGSFGSLAIGHGSFMNHGTITTDISGDLNVRGGLIANYSDGSTARGYMGVGLTASSFGEFQQDEGGIWNIRNGKLKFAVNNTGVLEIDNAKISGSSTSTGSFGDGRFAGKVGIGDTGPAEKLRVKGTETTYITNIHQEGTGATNHGLVVEIDGSNASANAFYAKSGAGHLIMKGDGKVGIGTTAPGAFLHVSGSTNVTAVKVERNYAGNAGAYLLDLKVGAQETGGDPTILVQNLGSGTAAGFMGNVGIGTAIGAAALHVWSGNISGSSTSTGSFGDGRFAGKVGIGTTAPGFPLTVSTSTAGRALYVAQTYGSGTAYGAMIEAEGSATTNVGLLTKASGATNNYGLIVSAGNVGIGTTGPDQPLHVFTGDAGIASNTSFTQMTVETSGNSGINILSGANNYGTIYFGDSGTASAGIVQYGHGTNGDNLSFGTAGSIKMTISGSNVGIGTATPGYPLDVETSGDGYKARFANANNDGVLIYCADGGQMITDALGTSLAFGIGGNEKMRVHSDGKVGIGTASPTYGSDAGLHIHSDSNQLGITNDNTGAASTDGFGIAVIANQSVQLLQKENQPMDFYTNDAFRMRIDKDGNVGIGADAPEGILEVGDISTGSGGMLIKRMSLNEDQATTFWTTPGENEWAGIIEITAVATDDVNRSAYQLSRFAYDDTFTSLIASAQNTSITLSMSGNNMQITMTGAGSTDYNLVIRIMGSEES